MFGKKVSQIFPGESAARLPDNPIRRTPTRWLRLAVGVALVALVAAACGTPTLPCGTLTYTGAPHANRGVNTRVDFNFNPATCGATCTCNTIAYIQIVRIIDRNTGNFLAPGPEQRNRIVTGQPDATQNGWSLDRIDGRTWGYYGRNNDGTFALVTPGSNTSTATLVDGPSGWPDNSWFDAVSVPVCIDAAASCNNRLLGYEYWLFIVNNGAAGAPFSEVGVTWMQTAVDRSVTEWNTDAPGLGKTMLPGMTPLP